MAGLYIPEIAGALSQCDASRYTMAKFLEGDRVKKRFLEDFTLAYNALVYKPDAAAAPGDAAVAASAAVAPPPEPEAQKLSKGDKETRRTDFQKDSEAAVRAELEARMVVLSQDGSHQEVTARMASTRLYENLTDKVKFMGFYDVKNARLMERRPTETVGAAFYFEFGNLHIL